MGILRILLALAVVVHHSSTQIRGVAVGGPIAVQAFFIISGFYIALILNRKYDFAGGTWLFYQQRYLRLAPMYWLAIFSTLAACTFYSLLGHHLAGQFRIWAALGPRMSPGCLISLILAHLTMVGQDAIVLLSASGTPVTLHYVPRLSDAAAVPGVHLLLVEPAWSLSVEILFYLCAPFIVRRSVRFQASIVALTFAARIFAMAFMKLDPVTWNYHFFPFEAGLFLTGSIGYRFLPHAERLVRSRQGIRLCATALTGSAILFYDRIPLPDEVLHWGFLALVAVSVPLLFAATQRDPVDRWLAEMSYPLYLLHEVTFFVAEPLYRRIGGIANEVLTLLLPLAVAALVYMLIERPFESWRARRFERRVAAASLAARVALDSFVTAESDSPVSS